MKKSFCVVVAIQQMGLIRRCRRETEEVGVHGLDFQQIQGGQQIRDFGADAFGETKPWLTGAVARSYFILMYSICWRKYVSFFFEPLNKDSSQSTFCETICPQWQIRLPGIASRSHGERRRIAGGSSWTASCRPRRLSPPGLSFVRPRRSLPPSSHVQNQIAFDCGLRLR
jgi:hypothetical protein